MSPAIEFRYFAHSWVSDWNHGNAHFLRGLARALQAAGHRVGCYEQLGSWSLTNLIRSEGEQAIDAIDEFRRHYPSLDVQFYQPGAELVERMREELRGAQIVILHEWNDPSVVNAILELKAELGFRALLHDTHHRAFTDPRAILRMHLHLFDGVLTFGEAIRKIYADGFGVEKVWTFHEAADVEKFYPQPEDHREEVLWIGNWGDEERTSELQQFLIKPAKELPDYQFVAHGVRYPDKVRAELAEAGVQFRGYLPNLKVPQAYAQAAIALHVPRRQYANGLSGIPTIRVFEALACGTPLVCSPWDDVEGLFTPGTDYVCVPDGEAMKSELRHLLRDDVARCQIAAHGLETVRKRHTCAHRAAQLADICQELLR